MMEEREQESGSMDEEAREIYYRRFEEEDGGLRSPVEAEPEEDVVPDGEGAEENTDDGSLAEEGESGEEAEGDEEVESGDPVIRISGTDEFDRLPPDRVIYRGRPSWLSYPKSVLLAVVALTAGIMTWELSGWILFGALVLTLAFYIYVNLARSMWLYLVTPARVEVVYGLVSKSSQEVRVCDIRAINVRRSGLKGLLGVGTVEFASAGSDGADVMFQDVWAAHRVKKMVRRLQDEAGG